MAVVAAAGGSQRSSTIRLKIVGILVWTSPGGAYAHSIRPSLGFQTIPVIALAQNVPYSSGPYDNN
jgi:hypothetical protein